MEQVLKYDLSSKYFCNFGLMDQTPDYTFFSKFREKIGTKLMSDMFKTISKVAVTPANVHDGKAAKHVLPKTGAILGEKIYGHG